MSLQKRKLDPFFPPAKGSFSIIAACRIPQAGIQCHRWGECFPYQSILRVPQLTCNRTHLARAALWPDKGKEPVDAVGGLTAGSPYMQVALNYRRQHLYMCVALENIRNHSSCVLKANLNRVWNKLKIKHMLIFAFCSSCRNQPACRRTAMISIKNTWQGVLYHPPGTTLNYTIFLPLHKIYTPLK